MPVFGAIGVAVAGSLTGATIAATSLGAIALGVVSTAVVGAAIGGLTAAVTGGDIGKGMLFGAIGGVATAGIASGVSMAMGGTGTLGFGASGSGVISANTVGTGMLDYEGVAAGLGVGGDVMATGGGSSLFGGALGKIGETSANSLLGQVVTKGIDFLAGALKEDPYNPNMDPEFLRENREDIQAHDKEMAKLAASLRSGGGGGGGSSLPWSTSEAGVKYTLAEQYKQAQLAEDSAMARLEKQYALQDENMKSEYETVTAKYGEAAGVAGGQEYQGASDEAKAAVLAKQAGVPQEETALVG